MFVLMLFVCIVATEGPSSQIYTFSPHANRFLAVLFPTETDPSPVSNAFQWAKNIPEAKDLEEVYQFIQKSYKRVNTDPVRLNIGPDTIDSYWHVSKYSNAKAERFLRHCREQGLLEILEAFSLEELLFSSPLEKALFQRDVYQVYCLLHDLVAYPLRPDTKEEVAIALDELGTLFHRLLLSRKELEAMKAIRPHSIDKRWFQPEFDGNQDSTYLPRRVIGEDADWFELPYHDQAPKHFNDFQGRSFIRLFIRPPGMSGEDFIQFWDRLIQDHGEDLTHLSNLPPLPPLTQTLLLRTFGVFLEDGTYTDSGFPEMVLMRIMKYAKPKLDPTTADFRGTVTFSYVMQRKKLMAQPASLGLVKDDLDKPSFLGFHHATPDPRNAYADNLVTIRFNCITCHSELLYGTSTIFSIARKRPVPPGNPHWRYNGMLLKTSEDGFFILNTPQYNHLIAKPLERGRHD